ncbi:uncharacterized protein NDAI_0H03090 [Naumovozyma dairenensis CBS 421]|uniref:Enoyl reductase (ER) domain-containing protein n=1 Tax=Naumovozyma dairenensis (strain ATCC 10597 / BCRC 20456 / CBS 421 / NBRC 0211 / NRRL Y-12639) TaxID=1071378 RepID=G0WFC1_NAUDC|nr:hypothetical protein NDAI_0H03090 [Naumovozyma dairenensis CBS 421]CCD26482.1 hypothetical protein NDAI_0H03090 [Naumovozyma dairenensis CBS 421]
MTNIVTRKTVTFINNQTPPTITETTLDLDTCYNSNEIVIEVHAAALNPIDFVVHEFSHPKLTSSTPKGYSRDYSGIIIRKGAEVAPIWDIGDHVNGMFHHVYADQGSLTNYLILDPTKKPAIGHIVENPSTSSSSENGINNNKFVTNAAWPLVFGTAYTALIDQGQIWNNDSRILVIGASTSVSNCFVQIAKNQLHVGTVVGICSSKSAEYNKKMGYDYTVSYDEGDGTISNLRKLMETPEFSGKKFDLIFDSVGNSEFFPVIHEFLKPKCDNSYYLTVVGDVKVTYEAPSLIRMASLSAPLRMYNPWSSFNYKAFFVPPRKDWMDFAARMITLDRFTPQIDSVFKFEEFQDALKRLRSNKAKGKVVISIKE